MAGHSFRFDQTLRARAPIGTARPGSEIPPNCGGSAAASGAIPIERGLLGLPGLLATFFFDDVATGMNLE